MRYQSTFLFFFDSDALPPKSIKSAEKRRKSDAFVKPGKKWKGGETEPEDCTNLEAKPQQPEFEAGDQPLDILVVDGYEFQQFESPPTLVRRRK